MGNATTSTPSTSHDNLNNDKERTLTKEKENVAEGTRGKITMKVDGGYDEDKDNNNIDLDIPPSYDIDVTHLQKVAPGFVYLKKALSERQQRWLVQYALITCGPNDSEPQKSFWMPRRKTNNYGGSWLDDDDDEEEPLQLNLGIAGRGRVYDALDNFDRCEMVQKFALELVKTAQAHDDTLPAMRPTHMILLYYATTEGMVW